MRRQRRIRRLHSNRMQLDTGALNIQSQGGGPARIAPGCYWTAATVSESDTV